MEDEIDGVQEEADQEEGACAQGKEGKDYEALLAEQAKQISELQQQIAEAAKNAEKADKLARQIEELKSQAEEERIDYKLSLAGCRSTRAGKALLDEHGGDIEALKAAEPWLFCERDAGGMRGKTGLEPAGVADGAEMDLARWRKLAGLDD